MSATLRLRPGTVVGVPATWQGFEVEHVGIVTDAIVDGERTVVSNSKRRGGVVEETLADFLDGQPGRVIGFPGRIAPRRVLSRARGRLGRPWSISNNCEHFVRFAHGLLPRSPQLQGALQRLGIISAGVILLVGAS